MFTAKAVQASEVVHMGAVIFPPSSEIDKKTNQCVGSSIDVTKHILKQYDIELEVTCASAIRIYKLVENGDIDLTINVKSTSALTDNVIFMQPAYGLLKIGLYERITEKPQKVISVIRGFGYAGFRDIYASNGFEFIDLPNSISVLRVFERHRSDYMLAYERPVKHFVEQGLVTLGDDVKVTPLFETNNYFAIAKKSPKKELLIKVLEDYAKKNNGRMFSELAGLGLE